MERYLDQIVQLGIVVKDAKETAALFHDVYAIGPWQFYTMPGYKSAICNKMNVQFELIEPTQENQFKAFLDKRGGNALYCVGYTTKKTYDETKELFASKGNPVLEGNFPDGSRYAFLDAYNTLGFCLKINEKDLDLKNLSVKESGYPGMEPEGYYPADNSDPTTYCYFTRVSHLCISTPTAMDYVKRYNDEYGIGPWIIVDLNEGPIINRKVHGKLVPHVTTATNCFMSDINFEINVGEDANSSYSEFVAKNGSGFHHMLMEISCDEDTYLKFLTEERGFEILQEGTMKTSGFPYYYIGAEKDLGVNLETFAKFPSPSDPPEFGPPLLGTYPEQA